MRRADVLVLGGGVAGLAAASSLGERACVLERDDRPGGLVRAERIGDYWFDHVIHMLHLSDPATEARLRALLGDVLQPCPPVAYVECAAGTARYPLQSNLWPLDPATVERCVADFLAAGERDPGGPPTDHRDLLLRTFGAGLCDLFFFPYQRKMWKRPLAGLAPAGFQWNIARPDADALVRGSQGPPDAGAGVYNHNGWYPRPPAGADVRCMEVLSRGLASGVHDLRLGHTVTAIDPARRRVSAAHAGAAVRIDYGACVSTLPLPITLGMVAGAPASLRRATRSLTYNRVRSVMLCVEGERPAAPGLWRYYADESVVFTRIIFMTEFDPLSAPDGGFGLLVEVTERAEDPPEPQGALLARVERDLRAVGRLRDTDRIVGRRAVDVEHAYVVFSPGNQQIVADAAAYLRGVGIEPLGRYGRWEYSSMASVIADGFALGEALGGRASA